MWRTGCELKLRLQSNNYINGRLKSKIQIDVSIYFHPINNFCVNTRLFVCKCTTNFSK